MGKAQEKLKDLVSIVRNAVMSGSYLDTHHSGQENPQRGGAHSVSRYEIEQVLLGGRHEPAKDRWDDPPGRWSYAFRGHTLNGRELRVVITFFQERMRIVTAFCLEEE